jgi:hypothetical protein
MIGIRSAGYVALAAFIASFRAEKQSHVELRLKRR